MPKTRELTHREVALLLAGLRLLQQRDQEKPPSWGLGAAVPPGIGAILEDAGVGLLRKDEIDRLCEAINVGRFRREPQSRG